MEETPSPEVDTAIDIGEGAINYAEGADENDGTAASEPPAVPEIERPHAPPPRRRHRPGSTQAVDYSGQPKKLKEHQLLLLEITRLGVGSKRLAPYLAQLGFKCTPSFLKTQTVEELREQRDRMHLSVLSKGGSEGAANAFFAVARGIEVAVEKSPLRDQFPLTGWSDVCRQNEQVSDLLELIVATRGLAIHSSPEMMLFVALLSCAGKTVVLNRWLRNRTKLAEAGLAPPPEEGEGPPDIDAPEESKNTDPPKQRAGDILEFDD